MANVRSPAADAAAASERMSALREEIIISFYIISALQGRGARTHANTVKTAG
jgi:hypothetical protein